MPSLKTLRKRVATVRSTQQITKAMKMVAAAKLRRAEEAVVRGRPFADRIAQLVATLAGGEAGTTHPLLVAREVSRVHVVVITGDRGLCGAYNSNLIRRAELFLREIGKEATLTAIGRKGAEYFRRRGASIAERLPGPVAAPVVQTARALAARLTQQVLSGEIDAVYMVYATFRSIVSQVPTVRRLIPVEIPETAPAAPDFVYEPSADAVLAALLPRYVTAEVARALLEGAASEQGARMAAMDNATRNASELIDRLTLQMNRARQAAITRDLMEIVSGAEALKG
jgi:F-type H+-transporting ATPase subunit gamma